MSVVDHDYDHSLHHQPTPTLDSIGVQELGSGEQTMEVEKKLTDSSIEDKVEVIMQTSGC